MKRIWKSYFSFSSKERLAMMVLLLLMGVFIAAPYIYQPAFDSPPADSALINLVQKVNADERLLNVYTKEEAKEESIKKKPVVLFYFDPNTLDLKGWQQLGLSERTSKTIVKYTSKGGRFRTPEDILKIWGMPAEIAQKLIPFIQFSKESARDYVKQTNFQETRQNAPSSIDINLAGENEWLRLPGIGAVLSKRILSFRNKLGGFVSIDQVKKTYGLSDSVYQIILPFLKIENNNIPKDDLNTVSFYQLKKRTHLPDEVLRNILVYRQKNGLFQSLLDLKNIQNMDDSIYNQLLTHVKVN